jgi:uncharacterized membrane protein
MSADVMSEERLQATKNLTAIVYALQAVGFLLGITWVVAIIVNYVKKEDVKGTWLESHFRWQIRTFWYGLLWVGLCGLFILMTLGIGIIVAWLPLAIVSLWFVYRVVRGWLALRDGRAMYV